MRLVEVATPLPESVLSLERQEPGVGLFRLRLGRISKVIGRSVSGTAGAEDVTGGLTSVTISGIGRVVGLRGAAAAGWLEGAADAEESLAATCA